jgi:Na+-driven multidrug efflux pump
MSWIGLVRIMAGFGSVPMAGHTIAIRIVLFALLPAYTVLAAVATVMFRRGGWKLKHI